MIMGKKANAQMLSFCTHGRVNLCLGQITLDSEGDDSCHTRPCVCWERLVRIVGMHGINVSHSVDLHILLILSRDACDPLVGSGQVHGFTLPWHMVTRRKAE